MIAPLVDVLLACPTCAQNADAGASSFWFMLGAMVLLPYPAAAAVIWMIRRANKAEQQESGTE